MHTTNTTHMHDTCLGIVRMHEHAGQRFVDLLKHIRGADYQAEAYFNVVQLPSNETLNQKDGDYRFMTLSIGTIEQYKQYHIEYNVREHLNAGVSTQTKGAAGIKSYVPHVRS